MKYYLAPMEGITGFVFRNAHHDYFGPMDKYFAPFISPNQNICFTPREYRDICPENNRIPNVIPQILTNKAEDFIKTLQELAKMGYTEVNLNLGCPSGTVTAKRKGAGFLLEKGRLREFFDRIFERPCIRISVKTRLGMNSTDEFPELLAIFNDYPLEELIIHPRMRKEFYDGMPHRDVYLEAVRRSKNPLCYNGDLYCAEDVRKLMEECKNAEEESEFAGKERRNAADECVQKRAAGEGMQGCGSAAEYEPKKERGGITNAVMFGRGILRDPWLAAKCRESGRFYSAAHIREFSDRLFSDYAQYMGERNAMFRMKELWLYLAESFADADANRKKLKKAQNGAEFAAIVQKMRMREDV